MDFLTDPHIIEYIETLDFNNPSSNEYEVFNKLLLVDSELFREVLDLLAKNIITIEQLLELEVINDNSIETFLKKIKLGVNDYSLKRKHFIDFLDNELNFQQYRRGTLSQFSEYIYNKFQDDSNIFIPVTIDPLGLEENSFINFAEVEKKYLSLVGFKDEEFKDRRKVNDLLLDEKYEQLLELYENNPDLPSEVKDLVELAFSKPIFIYNGYNVETFLDYPLYRYLFRRMYNFISPNIFNKVYSETLDEMVLNFDNDNTGWETIKLRSESCTWEDLISKIMKPNFGDEFMEYYLIKIFYPSVYSLYHSDVDVSESIKETDSLKDLFDIAADILTILNEKVRRRIYDE